MGALATLLYVALLTLGGIVYRRAQGGACWGSARWPHILWLAGLTLWLTAPHVYWAGLWALTAAPPLFGLLVGWFLSETDNGKFAWLRYWVFGLGYIWAEPRKETIRGFRCLGVTWIKANGWTEVGEAFLGGSTLLFLASISASTFWIWGLR